MADALYTGAILRIMNQTLDLINERIKVMLVNETYVFDPSHVFVNEISDSEVSSVTNEPGYGYVDPLSGRKLIDGKILTTLDDNSNETNRVYFKANPTITWDKINVGRVKAAILFAERTDDNDSVLIAYKQEGGFPIPTDGHQLVIRWNNRGLFSLSGVV